MTDLPAGPPAAANRPEVPQSKWAALSTILLNIVVPIALYYVLRAFGFSEVPALIVSAIVPALSFVGQLAVKRRVDSFAVFVMVILVLSVVISFGTGNRRTLLARDGWLAAASGIYILVTLFFGKPFIYTVVRPLLEGRFGPKEESWDSLWARIPLFRRVWVGLTLVWGIGIILNAVLSVIFAYTVAIDVVPGLSGIQYVVMFVLLQIASQIYFRMSGLLKHPDFVDSVAAGRRGMKGTTRDDSGPRESEPPHADS